MSLTAETIARKYTEALLEIAEEQSQVAEVGTALHRLQGAIAQVPELLVALTHPKLGDEHKRELLNTAAGRPVVPLVTTFLELLMAHSELAVLAHAGDLYEQCQDQRRGVQRARVATAVPLSEQQRQRLATALAQIAGGPVVLEERVTPNILGGLRISLDHRIIDASLRGRLQRLGQFVQRAPVPVGAEDDAR